MTASRYDRANLLIKPERQRAEILVAEEGHNAKIANRQHAGKRQRRASGRFSARSSTTFRRCQPCMPSDRHSKPAAIDVAHRVFQHLERVRDGHQCVGKMTMPSALSGRPMVLLNSKRIRSPAQCPASPGSAYPSVPARVRLYGHDARTVRGCSRAASWSGSRTVARQPARCAMRSTLLATGQAVAVPTTHCDSGHQR